MPGIYGYASTTADHATLLGAMAARMKHEPWYIEHRHVDAASGIALGRTSLGFVNAAAQPATNADGTLLAVMEGEVYDYDDQRRSLTAAGRHFQGEGHAELLLNGFEAGGKDFFRGLDGCFVAAIWDGRTRQLTLVSDRFGMKPLYYVAVPNRFLFASELKAILADAAVPRTPNLRGVAQFFGYAQLLGDDTLLDAVRYLPAAAWLTYDATTGRVNAERYAQLTDAAAHDGLSETELLDRVDEAFRRAVDRRTAGANRLGLSLSGGLDARTILGAIDCKSRPVKTVTLGMDGSMDHQSAARLAALAGSEHHNFTLSGQFLSEFEQHMRRLVYLTDGHYQSQCITMPTLPLYRELGVEVLLRGHAGELMHMDKAYSYSLDDEALEARDEPALEDWLFRHLRAFVSTDGDGDLFPENVHGQMEEHARDSLRDALRASQGVWPPVQRVWHLFLSQRLRRETALSMVEFGSVVETRLPYLDPELVGLLLTAPPRLKLGDPMQRHILRKHFPAALDVINTNTGARMGAGRVETFAAKVRMKVLAKLGVKGYQPYERLGLWLREELRPLVSGLLLDARCLDRGVLNAQTLRNVVASHLDGRKNHTFLLLALMIFELGQRLFEEGAAAR